MNTKIPTRYATCDSCRFLEIKYGNWVGLTPFCNKKNCTWISGCTEALTCKYYDKPENLDSWYNNFFSMHYRMPREHDYKYHEEDYFKDEEKFKHPHYVMCLYNLGYEQNYSIDTLMSYAIRKGYDDWFNPITGKWEKIIKETNMTIGQKLKKNLDKFNNSEKKHKNEIVRLLDEKLNKLIELSKKGITQYEVENYDSFIQLYRKDSKMFIKVFLDENLYFSLYQGAIGYDTSYFTIRWDKDNPTEKDCIIIINDV